MKRLLLTASTLFLFASAGWSITAQEEQQIVDLTLAAAGRFPFALPDTVPVRRLCGTPAIMEAKRRFAELSPAAQALLRPVLFGRPALQKSYDPPSSPFRIHFDTTGSGAVRGAAIRNAQGIPVWVDTLGMVLDSIWNREVVQLGFRPPVSDSFYTPNGGNGRRDVYLDELGGSILGYTAPDSAGGVLGSRATAFMVLDNDYIGFPGYVTETEQRRVLRVTAAHEFHHASQFAYTATNFETAGGAKLYWYEASAVWMEDQVYNDINDYRQYLLFWFRHPELSFRTFTQNPGDLDRYLHPYAMGIYGHYLSRRFPAYPVVRRTWESMATVGGFNLFHALDSALAFAGFMPGAAYPQRFLASLREFHRWNYFTGPKVPISPSDTLYGSEAAAWPTFDNPSLSEASHVDTTDVYPTRFPKPYSPCQSCPPSAVSFFCAPCTTIAGSPCLTDCAPVCRFVPYQLYPNPVCINDVEDLGASYLTLQNINTSSRMIFDLISDTRNRVPWSVAATGYNLANRSADFLTMQTTDPFGQVSELLFDDIGNYDEAVVVVVNDTLLPLNASRRSSTYAYAVTDSSIPPGLTRILEARPNPFLASGTRKVFFPVDLDSLSGDWEVSLVIFSPTGEIVYTDEQSLRGGVSHYTRLGWTGTNESGEPVASGVYFCKVRMNEVGKSREIEKMLKIALIRQ